MEKLLTAKGEFFANQFKLQAGDKSMAVITPHLFLSVIHVAGTVHSAVNTTVTSCPVESCRHFFQEFLNANPDTSQMVFAIPYSMC